MEKPIYGTVYGTDFRIEDLPREPGKPHLIIKMKIAEHDETGWETHYVKQDVAISLDTVYEILNTLGVEYKKKF